MFATSLLSLQKLSCMWTEFQWAGLYLLIHSSEMVGCRASLRASESFYYWQCAIRYFRGIPYRAQVFKFPLHPLEDSVLCMVLQTPVCMCLCGAFLHCCGLNPPHLGRACKPVSNHCINTTAVMKKDPNRCICLCFGKKILKPHLQYPLFHEPPFHPLCPDCCVPGNVFWVT